MSDTLKTKTQRDANDQLLVAVMRQNREGVLAALADGAEINGQFTGQLEGGVTFLHLSLSIFFSVEIAEILLAHGIDRYVADNDGHLPQELKDAHKVRWALTPAAQDALAAPSLDKLLTGDGKPTLAFLELCGAHKIAAALAPLFTADAWRGKEKEGIALWDAVKAAMPSYWRERFGDCVDLTPLRRNMQPAREDTAVGRYFASQKPPGAARGGSA